MFPKPTAEPAAASTNSKRLDHMPCFDTSFAMRTLLKGNAAILRRRARTIQTDRPRQADSLL